MERNGAVRVIIKKNSLIMISDMFSLDPEYLISHFSCGIIPGHSSSGETMAKKYPEDIYKKLAKYLDDLPAGFPATPSGVELRILRRLFTPQEAELALHVSLLFDEPRVIAKRAKIPPEEAAARLEEMAAKGLIYSIHPKGRTPIYRANQFVIGIWEFHVNDLDTELIRDMEEYMPTLLDVETWKKAPQLRTIPVGESIPIKHDILAYESAEELVRSHKKFLVAPCICRRERRLVGEGCDKPEEACLVLGRGVDYYLRNKLGRKISQEEALDILKKADEAGLVLQPSNAQKIVNICCCCGCCCGVLRTIKSHPKPATYVSSPFIAQFERSTCSVCGTCIERCQMEALILDKNGIELILDRCIGCGLCVTTCPTGSLTLVRKTESVQKEVPETFVKAYISLAKARGKLNLFKLLGYWLRWKYSKVRSRRR
jgi:Pyruvate/2-oxoacid:ferredoxin oxidoreductase delta subunit